MQFFFVPIGAVRDTEQIRRLRQIGDDDIRLPREPCHLTREVGGKPGIQLAVIPHDGVDDNEIVAVPEIAEVVLHQLDLLP